LCAQSRVWLAREMANRTKKTDRKLHSEDHVNTAVDIQYVNNGASENITWADIVNVPAEAGEEYSDASKKNRPVAAMLAIDCENISKAHIPLLNTKVADEHVELEMTVTSEFTLVGYTGEEDDNIPDEETLQNYVYSPPSPLSVGPRHGTVLMDSMENGRSDMEGTFDVSVVKQEDASPPAPASRRGRPRRDQQVTGKDTGGLGSYSVVMKNREVSFKKCPFNCPECDRSFPTSGGLKMHLMVHTETRRFSCFVCGNAFESLRNLKAHVASHKPESKNFCDECGHWYKDKQILKKHSARHEASDGGKVVDCGMCGSEYDTEADLAEHVLDHVSEMKWNVCLVCGRRLAPLSSMEKHLRTHTGEKKATCLVCAREFAEPYNLKSHMRIHTGERPYSCPQCKRRFTSVSTLKNHILTHSSERQYACTYCDKRFRRSSHLVEHRRSHTGERPYTCVHCGKRFTTSTAVRSHLVSHTRENRFVCPVCNYATPRATSLRKHMRTHVDKPDEDSEKQYMCADCGRQFSRMKNMEKHMAMHRRRREEGLDDVAIDPNVRVMAKLYSCTKCDRSFARYRNFQKHVVAHGDVDAMNELAGQPFRHVGDKPYTCAECGRPFARMGNMQKHFMTHWDQEIEDDKSDG